MSFRKNDCQQMTLNDSFINLTAREQKALENSWAEVFSDEIFPNIDESIFSTLYSDKASRPNTPVNVIVGALIIKELFNYYEFFKVLKANHQFQNGVLTPTSSVDIKRKR